MIQSLEAIVQLAMSLAGTYVAAIWLSLIVWTVRDIRKRTDDIVVVVLSTLLVVLFSLPGWFLYLILRPPELLADLRIRRLQTEILTRELASNPVCVHCEQPVESDFRLCPSCGVPLKSDCSGCGRLIESKWLVCPYCATSTMSTDGPTLPSKDISAAPQAMTGQRPNGIRTTGTMPAIQGAYTLSANPQTPVIRTSGES